MNRHYHRMSTSMCIFISIYFKCLTICPLCKSNKRKIKKILSSSHSKLQHTQKKKKKWGTHGFQDKCICVDGCYYNPEIRRKKNIYIYLKYRFVFGIFSHCIILSIYIILHYNNP